MNDDRVLIIDADVEAAATVRAALTEAGVPAESVDDAFVAMEKLQEHDYCAVILDPTNGYAVLNFIELERPEILEHLYLLTGMSEQTIRRTAPSVLPRLFRKPSALSEAAAAVIEACRRGP